MTAQLSEPLATSSPSRSASQASPRASCPGWPGPVGDVGSCRSRRRPRRCRRRRRKRRLGVVVVFGLVELATVWQLSEPRRPCRCRRRSRRRRPGRRCRCSADSGLATVWQLSEPSATVSLSSSESQASPWAFRSEQLRGSLASLLGDTWELRAAVLLEAESERRHSYSRSLRALRTGEPASPTGTERGRPRARGGAPGRRSPGARESARRAALGLRAERLARTA